MIAVKTNTTAIEKAIQDELKFSNLFQKFADELFKNKIDSSNTWKAIRDLIYIGSLDTFLQENTAKTNIYFLNMPIKESEKLKLIDLEKEYANYHEMKVSFSVIERLPLKVRAKINSFYIDENKKLNLNDNFLNKLQEENTVYLNESQFEAYEKVKDVLKRAQSLQKEHSINIFSSGLIVNTQYGNLSTSDININFIKSL